VIGLKVVVVVISAGVEAAVVRAGVVVVVGIVMEELDGDKLGEEDDGLDIGDEAGGDEGDDDGGGVVEEDTEKDEDVDSGGSEDTDLFVVREYLCENSAEIPTKQKHEGDETPK
jgi:hypothetical protein